MFDHVKIGDTHVFHHQERRRAHHGRHDLAVNRRRHFDRARLFRAETDLFHQRNRKRTSGYYIRYG